MFCLVIGTIYYGGVKAYLSRAALGGDRAIYSAIYSPLLAPFCSRCLTLPFLIRA